MGVFLLSDFMLIPLVILTIRCSAGVFGFLSLGNRFLHYGHGTDGHVHFTSIRIHFTTIRAFIKYTDTDALKYVRTPWLPSRSRGGRRWKRLLVAFLSSSGGHGTRPCRRSTVHEEGGRGL